MDAIELIPIEDWPKFVEAMPDAVFVYVQTTNDIITHMKQIMDKSKTFDELKQELLAFYNDRVEFVKFAEKYTG